MIFVAAKTLGMRGAEAPEEVDGNPALIGRINAIRRAVAHRLGFGEYFDSRPAAATPFCVIVSPPGRIYQLQHRPAGARRQHGRGLPTIAAGSVSRAYAATVTACTGVAARLEGSVLHTMLASSAHDRPKLPSATHRALSRWKVPFRAASTIPGSTRLSSCAPHGGLAEGRTFLLDGTSEP